MGARHLTGAPWHIEYLENYNKGKRRSKTKCKYYNSQTCALKGICNGIRYCADFRFNESSNVMQNSKHKVKNCKASNSTKHKKHSYLDKLIKSYNK